MILVSIYILLTSYCRLPAKLTFELRKNSIVRKPLEFVDENICLYTDKNSEFFNMIIKTVQNYIWNEREHYIIVFYLLIIVLKVKKPKKKII